MRASQIIAISMAASAVLAQPVVAQELPLSNGNFGAGVHAPDGEALPTHIHGTPGWEWSGGNGTGRWNPSNAQMSDDAEHGVVAYATGAIGTQPNQGFLAQLVSGVVIEANTRYTLTVDVGYAAGQAPWGYDFGLLALLPDDQVKILAQALGGIDPEEPPLPSGHFFTVSLDFETADFGDEIGSSLIVALGGLGLGAAYDNVRVTATSRTVTSVPEPATWAIMLFGFGAAGTALRRKRTKSAQPA